MAKILVTGGAGFIGSHLAETLLGLGHRVTVLDNFMTGSRENLAPFAGDPAFELVVGDIRSFDDCRRAVSGAEYVLHEAALGSVPRSMADPRTTWEINSGGFLNMLEAARLEGVKRFVYASSSSVYGDDERLPKREGSIGSALSPYALSKQSNEEVAAMYARVFGVETIGLRYFNVFGPRQSPQGAYAAVIPKFAQLLLRHESPVINGDGGNSRDFTYIGNVVRANLLALEAAKASVDRVYNVACGERTTLNELFACLRGALAAFDPEIAKVEAKYGPERPGDIPHSHACIDEAKKLLGYVPEHDVRSGLELTAKWYFDNSEHEEKHWS